MNILRLSTLSLTLAIAVFALGYVNPASAAKKDIDCETEEHPSCKDDGGGDPEPTATFSVVVDLDGVGPGTASEVMVTEVKINGNRQGLNGTMVSPDLRLLTTSGLPCNIITWGNPGLAQFSISTAKIPPSSTDLTYVEANIYDFTLSSTGDARFTLSFVPDTPLTFNDRLFPPTDSRPNVLAGSKIGVSLSPDHDSCSGTITE